MSSIRWFTVFLLLILGCGGGIGDDQVQEGNVSQTLLHGGDAGIGEAAPDVAYSEDLPLGKPWDAYRMIPNQERPRLNPLQREWLALANTYFKEIEDFNTNAKNSLVQAERKKKSYLKQEEDARALKQKIYASGIDNWSMVLTADGLGFAPGRCAVPIANNFFEHSLMYSFNCFIGDNRGVEGGPLVAAMISHHSISDLNPASLAALGKVAEGESVFVSLPPRSFEIRHPTSVEDFGAMLSGGDSNYLNKVAMCIYPEGVPYEQCYTVHVLHVPDVSQLQITLEPRKNNFAQVRQQQEQESNRRQIAFAQAERKLRIDSVYGQIHELHWANDDVFNRTRRPEQIVARECLQSIQNKRPPVWQHLSFENEQDVRLVDVITEYPEVGFFLAAAHFPDDLNFDHAGELANKVKDFVDPKLVKTKFFPDSTSENANNTVSELTREVFLTIRWEPVTGKYFVDQNRLAFIKALVNEPYVDELNGPPSLLFRNFDNMQKTGKNQPAKVGNAPTPKDWDATTNLSEQERAYFSYVLKKIHSLQSTGTIQLVQTWKQ